MLNKFQKKFLYMYLFQSEGMLLDEINTKEELLGCKLGKKDIEKRTSGKELAKISYLQEVWTYNKTLQTQKDPAAIQKTIVMLPD